MINRAMPNAASDMPQLKIKPLVVPRKFADNRLYFYIVFTFARVNGAALQRPDGKSLPPAQIPSFLLNEETPWPTYLLDRLKRNLCEFGVRVSKEDNEFRAWNTIRVENPLGANPIDPQSSADWGFELKNGQPVEVAAEQWEKQAAELWREMVVKAVHQGHTHNCAFQASEQVYFKDQNLGDLYFNAADQKRVMPTTNPSAASDLRPGLRLEAISSRSLAKGLREARQQLDPNSLPPASKVPKGMQVILDTDDSEFKEFVRYLVGRDAAHEEIAAFVINTRRTWQRADDRNLKVDNRDAKFRDVFAQRVIASWDKGPTLDRVFEAYQDFVIYLGQVEVRRHGRFLDGARHRLVTDEPIAAHAAAGDDSVFHTIAHLKAVDSATPVPFIGFEEIVAQLQRYPGLMRRLGLAVYCSVDWSHPESGGADGEGVEALTLPLEKALSWIRIHRDDSSADHEWFIEPPTPTYCDLQLDKLFRAAPQVASSFSGPDSQDPDSNTLDVWQRYHVLPNSLYLVTQDDYSLAAARGDTSITPGKGPSAKAPGIDTDLGQFTRTEVNSVNFYLAPLDDQGQPQTVAEWLDQHMTQKRALIQLAQTAMSTFADEHAAKRMLASLISTKMQPVVTTFPNPFNVAHAIYAEQLIQGHTIDVFRPGKDKHWRSLCRRMVRVDLFPKGSLGKDSKDASRSWWVEDEGFLATSTVVAPRPYVGRLTNNPIAQVDFTTQKPTGLYSLTIDVIDTDNRRSFTCSGTCNVAARNSTIAQLNVSCLVYPLCDLATNVFASDMVIATPSGEPDKECKKKINVTDLEVHPIFHSADALAGVTLQALGPLKLIVADNQAPVSVGAPQLPRGALQFPILVASHGTRFLDFHGHVIARAVYDPDGRDTPVKNKLPVDFTYFTVEGERRYYAANWAGDNAFVPVATAGADDLQSAIGILNSLGAAQLLASDHLDIATQALDVLTVPNTQAILPKAVPDPDNPYGQAGIPEKLCYLRNSSRLTFVRGQVVAVDFDLTVKVVRASGAVPPAQQVMIGTTAWTIDGGVLPGILLPDNKTKCQFTLAVPNAPVDSQTLELVLHVKGTVGVPDGNAKTVTAAVGQFDILGRRTTGKQDPLISQLTITWSLKLNDFNKNTYVVRYDLPQLDNKGTQPNDRFLHPAACLGWYVESIGTAEGNTIAGRALPQHLLGTLVSSAKPVVLCFSDGTNRVVEPLSTTAGQTTPTGFYQVHEVFKDPSTIGTTNPKLAPCGAGVKNVDNLTVAGEIVRISTTAPRQVDIADLDQKLWTITWPDDLKLRGAFNGLPARPLVDLELGEFLVAHCDINPAGTGNSQSVPRQLVIQQAKVPDQPKQSFARGIVCLLGTIDLSNVPTMSGIRALAEGSTAYRQIGMTSQRQQQIEIWYSTQSLKKPEFKGQMQFTAPSIRVIFAKTVTQYAPPGPKRGDDSATWPTPIHATVSEIIGRWGNWSLTVPMPGNTDPAESRFDKAKNSRFKLLSIRPSVSKLEIINPWRDSWALPTMRFGQPYWFCVRRVDLAGNHFYDERLPAFEKLPRCAVSTLTTWEEQIDAAQGQQNGWTVQPPNKFRRTDLPMSPVLAYELGHDRPVYFQNTAAPAAPAAVATAKSSALVPVSFPFGRRRGGSLGAAICPKCGQQGCPGGNACPANLKNPSPVYLNYKRPRELFLLSDAFDAHLYSTIDAEAVLLPPVCQVETVYLQGNLDLEDYRDAASCIQSHDRNRSDRKTKDQTNALLAILDDGDLNYLGDIDAQKAQIQVLSYDVIPDDTNKQPVASNKGSVELVSPDQWPKARGVLLRLTAARNEPAARDSLPSLDACNAKAVNVYGPVELKNFKAGSLVTLALPPGTTGQAVMLLEIAKNGKLSTGAKIVQPPTWRSIHLIHATNAAMAKPHWDSLAEVLNGNPTGTPNTNRTLSCSFHIDRPSSGSYKVLAYWNELWDEAVPKQHQPAEFVITSECGQAKRARCVTPGFGYGATAVVLFESLTSPGAALPGITITPDKGLVNDASLRIVSPGNKLHDTLHIRVMRRPPLVRIAEAYAVIKNGSIESVEVVSGGGWYQSVPFVVAHDPQGDGSGVSLSAQLDQFGQVTKVKVDKDPQGNLIRGSRYSNQTRIAFYTHQYELPEQAIETVEALVAGTPKPDKNVDYNLIRSPFNQAFGSAGTRTVDYVVQVNSRFRDYLRLPDPNSPANTARERFLRTHVPRYSAPYQVVLGCQAKLLKPPVDYILRSFQWKVLDSKDSNIRNARTYFVGHPSGRITVRREPMVRIYLFRPWNVSGSEQLGVVVCPAILNTIRLPVPAGSSGNANDTMLAADGGAYNAVAADGTKELSLAAEPLDGYVIPQALRNLVSRVGYDPTQREEAVPPLHVDQFTARTPGTIYEYVSSTDLAAASPEDTPPVQQPVCIAAHDVHYDSAKERWYSDIRIRPAGANEGVESVPMLQLALVTYQPSGVTGNRISPIYRSDVIKLLGDRTLEVIRQDQFKFIIRLHGHFDNPEPCDVLPERHVIAKLLCRSSELPDEVLVYEGAASDPQPRAKEVGRPQPVDAGFHAAVAQEVEFPKPKTPGVYTCDVDFAPLLADRVKETSLQWTLAVEEYEEFAAAQAAGDPASDRVKLRGGRTTIRQLVFSYAFDL
jgi:hypothetical protein